MVSPLRKVLSFSLSLAIYTKDNNLNTKEPLSPFLFFLLAMFSFIFVECMCVPSSEVETRNYLPFFFFCVSFSDHFDGTT